MSTQIVKTEGRSPLAAAEVWQPSGQPAAPPKDDTVLDLGGVFRLLIRRRRWIYGSVALLLVLTGAACLVMTPRYKAMAQIELLRQEQGALAIEAQQGQTESGATQSEDSLNFSLTLQTAVSVLQSDALALRVIKELHLEDTPEFASKPLFMSSQAMQNGAQSIDQSPARRTAILQRWNKRLKVQSVAGTRMIDVSYSHPDPATAARIVNQLVSDYIEYRYEVRYAAAQRSTEWLNAKLAAVKSQAESAAKRLADASQAVGVYGSSDDHNIVVTRLEQLDAAATDAHSRRAAKETVNKLAQNGDPELLTGMVGGAQGESGPSAGTALLVTLRQQEADLETQYAEASAKYGPENPKLIQLGNKLQAERDQVKAETNRIAGRARQEFMAASSAEADANRALNEEKRIAADMQQKIAGYNIAKNESDSAQALYQKLLASANETPILAGVRTTDVNVVDAAVPPGKPASPVVPLYLAAGAVVGLLFGVAGAFIRDSVDTSLRNPEDIEQITQLPVLGVIPRAEFDRQGKRKSMGKGKSRSGLVGLVLSGTAEPQAVPYLSSSQSQVMESFRAVRSSILLSHPDNPRHIFMITSSQPGEGKSFSSLHLATALSQNGGRVLLVDADLRRATLSRTVKMAFRIGLTTLIAGSSDDTSYREVPAVPGLTFLPAGATPPNPAELMGSRKMAQLISEWRERFDFVVIDCPPVLPVTDAVVLSQMVDGVVMVTRFAVSKRQAISRAVRTLLGARAECFGVIVNDMDTQSSEYGEYGKYYGVQADEDIVEGEPELVAASGREKQ